MIVYVVPSDENAKALTAVVIHCFCGSDIPCAGKIVDEVIKMHINKEHEDVESVQVARFIRI